MGKAKKEDITPADDATSSEEPKEKGKKGESEDATGTRRRKSEKDS